MVELQTQPIPGSPVPLHRDPVSGVGPEISSPWKGAGQ
jgi:hypothetical protein